MIGESSPFPLEGARAGDGGGGGKARLPHGPVSGGVGRARYLRKNQTVAEKLLWTELRKLGRNIRRQTPIGSYVADFVCHSASLVIEIDGPLHDEPDQQAHDQKRTAWLSSIGYRVIRFSEKDVRDRLEQVVDTIRAETAPPPSPALPPSRGKGEPRYQPR